MEITNNALQEVAVNNSVVFSDTVIGGSCSILHRVGSALVTLRGLTSGCCTRARFRVTFGGNVALPANVGVAPTQLAISIDGEQIASTTMITTPGALSQFNNVSSTAFIDVPANCCVQVGVKNIGATALSIQNANLIVERVA